MCPPLLLEYLIEQNRREIHVKGSASEFRERMRKVVSAEYPETEPDKRPEDEAGAVPESARALSGDSDRREDAGDAERRPPKQPRICCDRNAAPGNGARPGDKRLDDMRPHAICVDRCAQSASDPATRQKMRPAELGRAPDSNGQQDDAAV